VKNSVGQGIRVLDAKEFVARLFDRWEHGTVTCRPFSTPSPMTFDGQSQAVPPSLAPTQVSLSTWRRSTARCSIDSVDRRVVE
jgi:hypothetical protein